MSEELKQAEALRLLRSFNQYFTSANGVDVPDRISVKRDDWRQLWDALTAALSQPTQRPAAQTEREAFEAWKLTMLSGFDAWDAWQARASLPASQQATPEPLIVKGAMAGMVDSQVHDLWPTKGATTSLNGGKA